MIELVFLGFMAMAAVPAIDAAPRGKTETATFALGWFWGPDSRFGSLPGVIRTRVGYSGGTTKNPTYHNIGDHSESVQIEYDPARITYSQLLDVFWASHDAGSRPWKRQYMSAIFYNDEEQRRLAERSRDRESERTRRHVYTEITRAAEFTPAEGYHQKFSLRADSELVKELRVIYPGDADFTASSAAARLNGYVAGYGSLKQLEAEIDSFGLSESTKRRLREAVRRREAHRGDTLPAESGCAIK